MKIEKLERRHIGPDTGCGGATFSDVIDKVNEIIDALNGKEDPELRESESEKAKKIIASVFSEAGNRYIQKSERDIVLAYLEKQKINTEGDFARGYDCGYECCLNSHGAEWFEKQKEQKHVEIHNPTDEEVESWRNELTLFKKFVTSQAKQHKITIDFDHDFLWDNFCAELFSYLQKPVEWSEEDTEMYINVASSLRGYACGLENEEHKKHIKKGLDWLENRLKSLRPQKKEDLPKWRRIRAGEKIPCRAYLYKLAYENENNFLNKTTVEGLLIPNDPVTCGCDTWYLPVDEIKNLPKED